MGSSHSSKDRRARLQALVADVIVPILFPAGAFERLDHAPRQIRRKRSGAGDVEAQGSDILELIEGRPDAAKARKFLLPDDVVSKTGRTIAFQLKEGRNLTETSQGRGLYAEGSFALEFRNGAETFADPDVHARFLSELKHLPKPAAEDVLAAAVLPQTKTLLSVKTPLNVSVLGMPASLRFGILIADHGRLRLFAVGPVVKELSI